MLFSRLRLLEKVAVFSGKMLSVYFAILIMRHLLKDNDLLGHHEIGQLLFTVLEDF